MKWIKSSETELVDQKTYYLKFDKFEDAYSGRYFKDYHQFFSSAIGGNWVSVEGVSILDESPSIEVKSKEEILDIQCKCKEEEKHGTTSIDCCNHCGLPTEKFWTRE